MATYDGYFLAQVSNMRSSIIHDLNLKVKIV